MLPEGVWADSCGGNPHDWNCPLTKIIDRYLYDQSRLNILPPVLHNPPTRPESRMHRSPRRMGSTALTRRARNAGTLVAEETMHATTRGIAMFDRPDCCELFRPTGRKPQVILCPATSRASRAVFGCFLERSGHNDDEASRDRIQ